MKTKQVNSINEEKSYIPDETLVNFIQDWLQLHREKDRLTKSGESLTKEQEMAIRKLARMKVYVLDTMIFPAMANLIYFFDAMSVSEKLSEAFSDDIEELLDPRKSIDAAKFSGNDMRMSSYQFRENNLARLIMGALDMHTRSKSKDRITDFRIGLLYQLLNIVGDVTDDLLSKEFAYNQVWKSFYEDFVRMKGWMALLVSTSKIESKQYDRRIGFVPIWFSNKANLAGFSL